MIITTSNVFSLDAALCGGRWVSWSGLPGCVWTCPAPLWTYSPSAPRLLAGDGNESSEQFTKFPALSARVLERADTCCSTSQTESVSKTAPGAGRQAGRQLLERGQALITGRSFRVSTLNPTFWTHIHLKSVSVRRLNGNVLLRLSCSTL